MNGPTVINIFYKIIIMYCGICCKVMTKDVRIDGILACTKCRRVWLSALKKVRKYILNNPDDFNY